MAHRYSNIRNYRRHSYLNDTHLPVIQGQLSQPTSPDVRKPQNVLSGVNMFRIIMFSLALINPTQPILKPKPIKLTAAEYKFELRVACEKLKSGESCIYLAIELGEAKFEPEAAAYLNYACEVDGTLCKYVDFYQCLKANKISEKRCERAMWSQL